MSSIVLERVGLSDADAFALASIARRVENAQADLAAAQARLTRALADAEQLACRLSTGHARSAAGSDMAHRAVAAELAVPLRIADRTMQKRMTEAAELAEDYPATLDALEAGEITQGHVRVIVESGAALPRESRSAFEQRALLRCESDTAGRVRTGLRLLAERLHPRTLTERHTDARETRTVTVHPTDDGMCELTAVLPVILGDAIHDRLTRQAAALQDLRRQATTRLRSNAERADDAGRGGSANGRGADGGGADAAPSTDELLATDVRTMDQLRADLLADMLLTTQPGADPTRTDDGPGTLGAIRAHVQVVVPVLTLTNGSEHPADLAGRAPIDADTARRLAGGSCTGWDRILTHPISGQVLATDRYQPTPDLRRHLRARDAHCRFPGCRVPALRSEHDHTIDYALGGQTRLDNLEGLCQRHHSMKQFTGWNITQLGNGHLAWTSPLGRTYIDEPPPPTVHFVPDIDDDPALRPPF